MFTSQSGEAMTSRRVTQVVTEVESVEDAARRATQALVEIESIESAARRVTQLVVEIEVTILPPGGFSTFVCYGTNFTAYE